MPKKTLLSFDDALRAKELYYQDLDPRGRQKWTTAKLAELFEVSESTMQRAINSSASYREIPRIEVGMTEQQEADAEAALSRLQQVAAEELSGDEMLEELIQKAGTENAPISDEARAKARSLLRD